MSKQRRVIFWLACALTAGMIFIFGGILLFGMPADVQNIVSVSPDGNYTATLHSVDTGAAGSYCQALLRKTADDKNVILVDGGWEFVEHIEWRSNQALIVTTGLEGKPDPSWPKSWLGIKIVYK